MPEGTDVDCVPCSSLSRWLSGNLLLYARGWEPTCDARKIVTGWQKMSLGLRVARDDSETAHHR